MFEVIFPIDLLELLQKLANISQTDMLCTENHENKSNLVSILFTETTLKTQISLKFEVINYVLVCFQSIAYQSHRAKKLFNKRTIIIL